MNEGSLILESDVLETLDRVVVSETASLPLKKRKVVERKLIDCDECDFQASSNAVLRIHKLNHFESERLSERLFLCDMEGCDFRTTRRYFMTNQYFLKT